MNVQDGLSRRYHPAVGTNLHGLFFSCGWWICTVGRKEPFPPRAAVVRQATAHLGLDPTLPHPDLRTLRLAAFSPGASASCLSSQSRVRIQVP